MGYISIICLMLLPGSLAISDSGSGIGLTLLLVKEVAKLEVAVDNMKTRLEIMETKSTSDITIQDTEDLQSAIESQSQEIEKLKDDIKEMTKPVVAVNVELSENIKLINGQAVHYDKVITNIGDAYSTWSGRFVAPVSGTYIFSVTSCSLKHNWDRLIIVNNGVEIGRVLSGEDTGYNSCNSAMTTVDVKSGSAVWVERLDGTASATQVHFNGASFSAVLIA